MTPIVKADVLDFAAELVASDEAWTRILAFVNQIDLARCDSDEDRFLARTYLAAHLVKSAKLGAGNAAGPVTSEAVAGVRRSYGLVAMSSASSLRSTRYGQLFLDVLSSTLAAGPVLA